MRITDLPRVANFHIPSQYKIWVIKTSIKVLLLLLLFFKYVNPVFSVTSKCLKIVKGKARCIIGPIIRSASGIKTILVHITCLKPFIWMSSFGGGFHFFGLMTKNFRCNFTSFFCQFPQKGWFPVSTANLSYFPKTCTRLAFPQS